MSERRSPLLALVDDGAGQIDCPRKGLMAIERCRQWQRETAESDPRGSCACDVYRGYAGGEPDRDRAEAFPQERVLPVVRCGRTTAITEDDLDDGELVYPAAEERTVDERPPMATNNKFANVCRRCKKPGTKNHRVTFGIHRSCRKDEHNERRGIERAAAKARMDGKPTDAIAPVAPAPDAAAPLRAIASLDEVLARHTEGAAAAAALGAAPAGVRQQMIPVVAEQEIARLKNEVAERDRAIALLRAKLGKVSWLVQGVKRNYATIDELLQVELD